MTLSEQDIFGWHVFSDIKIQSIARLTHFVDFLKIIIIIFSCLITCKTWDTASCAVASKAAFQQQSYDDPIALIKPYFIGPPQCSAASHSTGCGSFGNDFRNNFVRHRIAAASVNPDDKLIVVRLCLVAVISDVNTG
jgi:hypothetical protein